MADLSQIILPVKNPDTGIVTNRAFGFNSKTATLISTGDTTDRSAEIITQLAAGSCVLGDGDFYISTPIIMPNNSELRGQGNGTRIIRLNNATGNCCIKMNQYNVVDNLRINGALTASSTIGSVHGISWEGDYSISEDSYIQPRLGKIHNVQIENCTGGGIYCNNTGYATFTNLNVTNVTIMSCSVGIYIPYWSEYHKFTNVQTYLCYYGCINNGGNNTFVNCDFSSSRSKGFVMDNSENDKINNGHGSAVCCIFNHINNNTGIAIEIKNIKNGFVFDSCQIFFGTINIDNTDGVQFNNCNYGSMSITINGEGVILFNGGSFISQPTITKINNTKTIFVNCYERTNGNPISQFAKAGSFTPSSGITSNLDIRQNGKIVSINGFLTGAVLVANTPLTLGTISGVDAPPVVIRSTCGVAVHAYDPPEQISYLSLGTNLSLLVTAKSAGTRAIYFNFTYVVP